MMRFMFLLVALLALGPTTVMAECPSSPTKDFDLKATQHLDQKSYNLLGGRNGRCFYFRDVAFKNGQGQQAVIVANSKGRCIGFFRTSLASGAELDGDKLKIRSSEGGIFKVEISKSIPSSIFFDGETVELEKCIK